MGSSKKQTVGYKYYIGLHFGLFKGEGELLEVVVDEKSGWTGHSLGGQITIDAEDLFGGEKREGGISGTVDFETGSSTQAPNSYLESAVGVVLPAFRGITAAVLRQVYVGLNPYLKKWAFRCLRIYKTTDGAEQWYLEKSAIRSFNTAGQRNLTLEYQRTVPMGISVSGGTDAVWYLTPSVFVAYGGEVSGPDFLAYRVIATDDNGVPAAPEFVKNLGATTPTNWVGGISDVVEDYYNDLRPGGSPVDLTRFQIRGGLLVGIHAGDSRVVSGSSFITVAYTPAAVTFGSGRIYVAERNGSNNLKLHIYDMGLNVLNVWDDALPWLNVIEPRMYAESGWVYFCESFIADPSLVYQLDPVSMTVADSYNIDKTPPFSGGTFNNSYNFTVSNNKLVSSQYLHTSDEHTYKVYKLFDQPNFYDQVDMNPAHIIRECVIDPDWGLGYQAADVDDVAFAYAADVLFGENFGLSLLWTRQTSVEEFIDEILRHVDGVRYVDKSTGKFSIRLIRDDYVLSNLLVLEEDYIEKIENYSSNAFGESVNTVIVKYVDAFTGKNTATAPVGDLGLIQQQGQVINTTTNYPGVSNGYLGARLAERDMRALSSTLRSCVVYTDRRAAGLTVGEAVIVNWPDLKINYVVFRLVLIDFGDGKTNRIRMSLVEDVFSLDDEPLVVITDPAWEPPGGTPVNASPQLLIEAPYFELVQQQGETQTKTLLADDPTAGFFLVSGGRSPSGASMIKANTFVDYGVGYEDTVVMDFAPFGQTVADILKSEIVGLVVVLELHGDIDQVTLFTHMQINDELMVINTLTEVGGNYEIEVGRAVLDTLPGDHPAGSSVLFWDEYGAGDEVQFADGETVNVKLQTVVGSSVLPLEDAPELSLLFASRAVRPYPPGNLKINGGYYPEGIGGTALLSLTWAHRDRIQQTSAVYFDFTTGDIGPEPTVYYELNIYGATDLLLKTENLTENFYVYDDEAGAGPGEDPFWANVVLLSNFNGTDGSTSFTDISTSAHTLTAGGNAQVDTDQFKFGGASVIFDGGNDWVEAADSSDWDLCDGNDFTIECWYRPAALGTRQFLCGQSDGGASVVRSLLECTAAGELRYFTGTAATNTDLQSGSTMSAGNWYHLAISREGDDWRLFLDGGLEASVNDSTTYSDMTSVFAVGRVGFFTSLTTNGHIDDFRITKGIARYTAGFTPPDYELAQDLPPSSSSEFLSDRLRFTLKSIRPGADSSLDAYDSAYSYDEIVYRAGWDNNWDLFWGEI